MTGILDGRYTNEQICELMMKDEKYVNCKERLRLVDTLIIDEVIDKSFTLKVDEWA